MLPDFVAIKRELAKRVTRQLRTAIDANAPVARDIKNQRIAEGSRFGYETVDGKVVEDKFNKIERKIELPANLSPEETHRQVQEKLQEVAKSIGSDLEKALFERIKEATDATGNVIDAKGQPFHPSMLWQMVEKMELDFDKAGNPKMPTMVVHPDMMKGLEGKLQEWEADPVLGKRRREVIAKKREEWRDREANRKLVG